MTWLISAITVPRISMNNLRIFSTACIEVPKLWDTQVEVRLDILTKNRPAGAEIDDTYISGQKKKYIVACPMGKKRKAMNE